MNTPDFKTMENAQLAAKEARWKRALNNIEQQARELRHNLQLISEEIIRRKRIPLDPRVSDHAVMRYLERVKGVDMDAIREEILTPAVANAIKMGATTVSIDGVKFVIDGDCLVTVLGAGMRPKKKNHYHEIEESAA